MEACFFVFFFVRGVHGRRVEVEWLRFRVMLQGERRVHCLSRGFFDTLLFFVYSGAFFCCFLPTFFFLFSFVCEYDLM